MVRVVDCHAGVLGSNAGGPKRFSPWNYFRNELSCQVCYKVQSRAGSPICAQQDFIFIRVTIFSI